MGACRSVNDFFKQRRLPFVFLGGYIRHGFDISLSGKPSCPPPQNGELVAPNDQLSIVNHTSHILAINTRSVDSRLIKGPTVCNSRRLNTRRVVPIYEGIFAANKLAAGRADEVQRMLKTPFECLATWIASIRSQCMHSCFLCHISMIQVVSNDSLDFVCGAISNFFSWA